MGAGLVDMTFDPCCPFDGLPNLPPDSEIGDKAYSSPRHCSARLWRNHGSPESSSRTKRCW